jgi:DNA replication licensing factor MCM3
MLGFDGALGGNSVTPRGLNCSLLRQLVLVEGIVTRGALVKPKVVSTVQFNPRNERTFTKSFRDATSSFGMPTATVFMSNDPDTKGLSIQPSLFLFSD